MISYPIKNNYLYTRYYEPGYRCAWSNLFAIITVLVFFASVLLSSVETTAKRKGDLREGYKRPSYGKIYKKLPSGHKNFRHGGNSYWHSKGKYYKRHRHGGFIWVRPPIGAVVLTLPVGFFSVVLGGVTYYHHHGVHYMPQSSGYAVVEPPRYSGYQVGVNTRKLNVRTGPTIGIPALQSALVS